MNDDELFEYGRTREDRRANEMDFISDGFGNYWSAYCPQCGRRSLEVVRPGKVQCAFEHKHQNNDFFPTDPV